MEKYFDASFYGRLLTELPLMECQQPVSVIFITPNYSLYNRCNDFNLLLSYLDTSS